MQDASATVHEKPSRPWYHAGRDRLLTVMAIAVALLVVAGVLVYVFVSSTTESSTARLEGALAATKSALTANLALNMKASFGGVSVAIAGTGAVDFSTGALSLEARAFGQRAALVETGGALYVKLGKLVHTEFPGKTWVRVPIIQKITGLHGNRRVTDDPERLMSVLLKLGDVTPIGSASIDGTQDQGYRVRLTVGALEAHASELPLAVRPFMKTVRRLPKSTALATRMFVDPAGQLQALHLLVTTDKPFPISISVDLTMSHFGTARVRAAPPAGRTVTFRRLGSSFGATFLA